MNAIRFWKKWIGLILFCLLAFLIQFGIEGMSERYRLGVDYSDMNLTRLSDATQSFLDGMDQRVDLYLFYQSNTNDEQRIRLETLLEQYMIRQPLVQFHVVDPILQPGLVELLVGKGESVSDGTVVAHDPETGLSKRISAEEMYTYTQDQVTGAYKAYAFHGENRVTNALVYLLQEECPQVFFLSGHEELGLDLCTTLTQELKIQNFEVKEIVLGHDALLPGDILVIAAPTLDLTQEEYQLLLEWMEDGGKLLFAMDPSVDLSGLPLFVRLLEYYGIAFENGFVIEDSTEIGRYINTPQYLIPLMEEQAEINQNLPSGRLVLPQCGAIRVAKGTYGIHYQTLLQTSSNAYLKKQESQTDVFTRQPTDPSGTFVIAVGAEDLNKGLRIVTIANIFTLADTNFLYSTNNLSFSTEVISWLAERENTLHIPSKKLTDVTLHIPDMKVYRNIAAILLIGFPSAVLLAGGIVWRWRRR